MENMFEKLFNLDLKSNDHYIKRYLAFIRNRLGRVRDRGMHRHHVLPKATDFFPEFKDLKVHGWNSVYLTPREHFIAHWVLARAFPGSSMSLAFYNMSNMIGRRSKAYQEAREYHIKKLVEMTQDPDRNRKISIALTGKRKSESHRNKLRGRRPGWHRQRISDGMKASQNMKWAHDAERVAKHRERLIGRPSPIWTEEQRANMAAIKTGLKATIETRKKMSRVRKGRKWFTNGVSNTQAHKPPDSTWYPGRITLTP